MSNKPVITLAHLADTEVHPLLAQTAMLDDAIAYLKKSRDADPDELAQRQAEHDAMLESIRTNGVLEPLYAVLSPGGKWLICDGRHRRAYALEAGHKVVPVIQVQESEARAVILRQNGQRRRQTKSQIGWLAVCVHPEVVECTQGAGRSDKSELSRTALAGLSGVSADVIDQACKLWKLVGKSKKTRAAVEAQIAAGCGLGGIIAGLAGAAALPVDGDKAKRPASSVPGLCRTLATVSTQLKEWPKWTPEQRELAVTNAASLFNADHGREFLTAVMTELENA